MAGWRHPPPAHRITNVPSVSDCVAEQCTEKYIQSTQTCLEGEGEETQ